MDVGFGDGLVVVEEVFFDRGLLEARGLFLDVCVFGVEVSMAGLLLFEEEEEADRLDADLDDDGGWVRFDDDDGWVRFDDDDGEGDDDDPTPRVNTAVPRGAVRVVFFPCLGFACLLEGAALRGERRGVGVVSFLEGFEGESSATVDDPLGFLLPLPVGAVGSLLFLLAWLFKKKLVIWD